MSSWTRTPPLTRGYYWYRGPDDDVAELRDQTQVLWWDGQQVHVVGSDMMQPAPDLRGEFWPERIAPPPDFSVIPLASERQKRQIPVCVDCGEVIDALRIFIPDPPQCQMCNPAAYR